MRQARSQQKSLANEVRELKADTGVDGTIVGPGPGGAGPYLRSVPGWIGGISFGMNRKFVLHSHKKEVSGEFYLNFNVFC